MNETIYNNIFIPLVGLLKPTGIGDGMDYSFEKLLASEIKSAQPVMVTETTQTFGNYVCPIEKEDKRESIARGHVILPSGNWFSADRLFFIAQLTNNESLIRTLEVRLLSFAEKHALSLMPFEFQFHVENKTKGLDLGGARRQHYLDWLSQIGFAYRVSV